MNSHQQSTIRSFDQFYIDGAWLEPSSVDRIEIVSPVNGKVVGSVPEGKPADMDRAVAAARAAFDDGRWSTLRPEERASYLERVAEELERRSAEIGLAAVMEIGVPISMSGPLHGPRTTNHWRNAARLHESYRFEEEREWVGGHGIVVKEPTGVVAAIVPWNGPVTISSLKIAPALAAGCTVVLKPAPEGALTPMLLAEAIEAAGLPAGVVNVVPAHREASEHLVRHPGVDKVSLTGSTAAGRRIMSLAGERIARVTLELGGKSAAVLVGDVPLEDVLPSLTMAGIGHSGQNCSALTRVLVPRDRQDELVDALANAYRQVVVGDPREPSTVLGPLVSERQRERVESFIAAGVDEGARLVVGGGRPKGLDAGFYVEPTLFADVTRDMTIAREEIFGPVVCVMPYDSIDEAVEVANDTIYGLSGAVYATDVDEARAVARRLRTGQVAINSAGTCTVQPFGGYGQSGIGREGTSVEALDSFMETKVIHHVG